jgi:hypothetical protein
MGKLKRQSTSMHGLKRAREGGNDPVLIFSFVCCVIFGFIASQARGDVTSCQANDQGIITSCMEFASGKLIPTSMEKVCTQTGSMINAWVKGPCPRSGAIGYCEIPRRDTITQVVYCYKKSGIPDKQRLAFCKQACKGRFAAY